MSLAKEGRGILCKDPLEENLFCATASVFVQDKKYPLRDTDCREITLQRYRLQEDNPAEIQIAGR